MRDVRHDFNIDDLLGLTVIGINFLVGVDSDGSVVAENVTADEESSVTTNADDGGAVFPFVLGIAARQTHNKNGYENEREND